MTLRWKKDEAQKGLARIAAGPRGSTLQDGDVRFATVSALRGHRMQARGWFWVAGWGSGIPHKNTCDEPASDEATAKAQAMAYVNQHRVAASKLGEQEGGDHG